MVAVFRGFSPDERKNLTIYMVGIMCYKFALETLTGCMSTLVMTRTSINPVSSWGTVVSVNYAMQSIGSLLVSPLIKRWPTSKVLATSTCLFGIIVLIVPILELLTGGGSDGVFGDEKRYLPGNWPIAIISILYPLCGILSGVVELVRRVIPKDLVGDDVVKLKKLDSTVHIGYELAGASGAMLSSFWISYFSYAYSLALIPIMFTLASLTWWRMKPVSLMDVSPETKYVSEGVITEISSIFRSFVYSVWVGFKLVMMNRSLVWLVFAYSLPLVMHRYLENLLFAQYAVFALGRGSYQQLILSGSNLGELLGAFFVLLFSSAIPSPIPWLRIDALALLIAWVLPCLEPFDNLNAFVWVMAAIMIPISFCWAAGDVSLVAYVQSRLAKIENSSTLVSPLGSVMSFLYIAYIVMFAILNQLVSVVQDSHVRHLVDKYGTAEQIPYPEAQLPTQQAMVYTAGLVMTIAGIITMISTFIPKGSSSLNPIEIESDEDLDCLSKQIQRDILPTNEKGDAAMNSKENAIENVFA